LQRGWPRAAESGVAIPDEINVIGCGPLLLHTSHKVPCGPAPAGHRSIYKSKVESMTKIYLGLGLTLMFLFANASFAQTPHHKPHHRHHHHRHHVKH